MDFEFSIDDVIKSFLWLEKTKASSIFDSRTFSFARWLWENYKIPTTCNCLYSDGVNTLSDVSAKYKTQFQAVSDWLRFSFHGLDYEKNYFDASFEESLNDYKRVESEIERICGYNSLSKTVRVHFFSSSEAAIKAWKVVGVTELLTADDNRFGRGINYNLSFSEVEEINRLGYLEKNGLIYRKTDIRLEKIKDEFIGECVYRNDRVVAFTHERFIDELWTRPLLMKLLEEIRHDSK